MTRFILNEPYEINFFLDLLFYIIFVSLYTSACLFVHLLGFCLFV